PIPVWGAPSPRSHRESTITPSGSELVEPSKNTVSPVKTIVGVQVNFGTGGTSFLTLRIMYVRMAAPVPSLMVTVTLYPKLQLANVWMAGLPVPFVPSPNVHAKV